MKPTREMRIKAIAERIRGIFDFTDPCFDVAEEVLDSDPATAYLEAEGARELPGHDFTARGFEDFTAFRDVYGTRVTVRQSSLATEDCVWIFAQDNPTMDEPSPHLNVEQAKLVADALYAFVAKFSLPSPPESV